MAQLQNLARMPIGLRAYVLLACLCAAMLLPGLSTLPPTDRDESLFAQASKQMVETGNYVDIRFQEEPRYKKPIGIYWLQSASVSILHPGTLNEIWAYRVPSFLGITLAVLMTAGLGGLLFSPAAGWVAAFMLLGCIVVNVEARIATTDAALLGAITTMQFALARARFGASGERENGSKPSWGNALLFWSALGLGLLIKGPIILLPLVGTVLWLWRLEKSLRWFGLLKPLPGLAYLALLVLPWFVAIMLASHGAFAEQSAGKDLLAKIWSGQNRGIVPPGVHLILFPFIFFPFSVFTYLGLVDIWRERRLATIGFCLGWIIPTWLVFELTLTKLVHYTMPTFPAIALLTAHGLVRGYPALRGHVRRWPVYFTLICWVLMALGYATALALAAALFGGEAVMGLTAVQVVAGLVLVGAVVFSCRALLSDGHGPLSWPKAFFPVFAAGWLFLLSVFGFTLPSLKGVWIAPQVVASAKALLPCPAPQIVGFGYSEPSLVFLGGTKTLFTGREDDVLAKLNTEPCSIAVVSQRNLERFTAALARGGVAGPVVPQARITGFNLGNGRWQDLLLFTPSGLHGS